MCQNVHISDFADAIKDEVPEMDITFMLAPVEQMSEEVSDEELESLE